MSENKNAYAHRFFHLKGAAQFLQNQTDAEKTVRDYFDSAYEFDFEAEN